MAPKRERSTNFTREESDILLKLVNLNKHVLENKKSDAVTWAEKEKCWQKIEKLFNSMSSIRFRNAKSLKIKYDGIKRERRKSAVIQAETYRSGGGPSTSPVLTDETEEEVKEVILLSVDGMDSTFDSDPLPDTVENQPINEQLSEDEQPQKRKICECASSHTTSSNAVTNTKWPNFKPILLQPKKPPALSVTKTKRPFERVADSKIEIAEIQKNLLEEELVNKRKQWAFEEEEREHKKEMWLLEKQYWLNKIKKNVNID